MAETTSTSEPHGSALAVSDSTEMRLILIGEREAGKSAVGNAILGTQAFDQVGVRTKVSVRKRGLVSGQQLAVVDTPGWEWFTRRGAPASGGAVRREIMGSVALCHPGAHALLLVVPLSFTFAGRERCAAEEHVELFGPSAWSHTLVVFTITDRRRLHDTSLEEEVEENEELQRLVERCGGRYHALHSHPRRGEHQVTRLLGKIQEMAAANRGALLPSEEILQEAREREEEEERRDREERKEWEEEMKRVREVMQGREMEERTEDESEDDEYPTRVQNKMGRQTERGMPESGEENDSEISKPSDLGWLGLRASCKTQ